MTLRIAAISIALLGLGWLGYTAADDAEPASPTFGVVDVYADPAGEPIAAYQFEVKADAAGIKLVGIEGGAHPAYTEPPYYDKKATADSYDHVIIAAFSTAGADKLPAKRTRVASIHYMSETGAPPRFAIKPITAATPTLKRIAITYELVTPTPEGTDR